MNYIDLTRAEALRALPPDLEALAGRAIGRKDSYPPKEGQPAVRTILADYLAARWNGNVAMEEVIVTGGETMAMASSILALTDPGDKVLLPIPGYHGPRLGVEALGRTVVGYDPERLLSTDPLPSAPARAMVVMNPQNPSGKVASRAQLSALADAALARDMALICDAAFLDFTWSGEPAAGLAPGGKRVTTGSLGKSLGLPNIRIGWARAEPALASTIAARHWALAMSAGGGNALLAAALLEGLDWVPQVSRDARARLEAGLAAAAGEGLVLPFPQGGLCVCVPLAGLPFSASEAARKLAGAFGVGVRAAPFFDGETDDWIRLGLGETPQETAEGYARVARFVRHYSTKP